MNPIPPMPENCCHHNPHSFRSIRQPFAVVLLLAAILMSGACSAPYDKDAMQKLFEGRTPPIFKTYEIQNRSIYFAEIENRRKPLIIFIHGTPGSWEAFGAYLADPQLSKRAHMISVDRPGFGRSGYKDLVPSLKKQAELLRPLLDRDSSGCGAIMVGHSLGAPLAARIAMDYPGRVSALLLIAPSLDPELESPRWYNYLATYYVFQWAVPTPMLLANKEVMHLQGDLQDMLPLWKSVHVPVVVIQGQQDELVMPANADFAEKMVQSPLKTVRVPDAGHFVLWENPDIIKRELLALLASRDRLHQRGCAQLGEGSGNSSVPLM